MQIPILSGILSDGDAEFRQSYPVNLIPVPKETGISNGYLRPADGITQLSTGPGIDRGGVNWRGVCYRVLGGKFCSVGPSGIVTEIGNILGSGPANFDYSFDRLAIATSGYGYYYDGTTLTQITDGDLGAVFDVIYVDGYFIFTDGVNLIQTELADATAIDPLKYGSAETDPDDIHSVHKLRNEPHAVGRYSIEVYENIGGDVFAFQRIEGARVGRGSMGRGCACIFGTDSAADAGIAFLGGGRGENGPEPPSVYLSSNATCERIATREIDTLLQTYTELELSQCLVESRYGLGHQHLYVHLPDRTLVYDHAASQAAGERVWFVLVSASAGFAQYRARYLVWCYDKWLCSDPQSAAVGELTLSSSAHYGQKVRWEFGTVVLYNEGRSGIVHELELVALTGRTAFGLDPYISTSYSKDGLTWSIPKTIKVGARGQRDKRLVWRKQGKIGHFRIQRFEGDSDSFSSFARLEAQIEPLAHAGV